MKRCMVPKWLSKLTKHIKTKTCTLYHIHSHSITLSIWNLANCFPARVIQECHEESSLWIYMVSHSFWRWGSPSEVKAKAKQLAQHLDIRCFSIKEEHYQTINMSYLIINLYLQSMYAYNCIYVYMYIHMYIYIYIYICIHCNYIYMIYDIVYVYI